MAGESLLALVNPRRPRRHASAKQIAWRKKFGRLYGGKRRRNPIGEIAAAAANPRHKRRRRNPIGLEGLNPRRRRRRHNPRMNIIGTVQSSLMPAVTAAGATLAVDLALGYLPIPDAMKTGAVRNVTRAVGIVALGAVAGMMAKADTVRAITSGGLSIVFYDTLKGFAQKSFPQLPLGAYEQEMAGLGYWGSGWNPDQSMGAYLPNYGAPAAAFPSGYDMTPAGVGQGDELEY